MRAPFPSNTSSTDLVFGSVSNDTPLRLESLMAENDVLFSDGIQDDFIAFNSGCAVELGISDRVGRLIV